MRVGETPAFSGGIEKKRKSKKKSDIPKFVGYAAVDKKGVLRYVVKCVGSGKELSIVILMESKKKMFILLWIIYSC